MSKFVKGDDHQDDETWHKEHANDPALRAQIVDNRSLFEKLQEQKAAKADALNEATKFSNLIRRLDNDEIDFLVSVREREDRENEKRLQERNLAIVAFKEAQARLDSLQNALVAEESAKKAVKVPPVVQPKRKRIITGVVKKSKKQAVPDQTAQDRPSRDRQTSQAQIFDKATNHTNTQATASKSSLIAYQSDSDD